MHPSCPEPVGNCLTRRSALPTTERCRSPAFSPPRSQSSRSRRDVHEERNNGGCGDRPLFRALEFVYVGRTHIGSDRVAPPPARRRVARHEGQEGSAVEARLAASPTLEAISGLATSSSLAPPPLALPLPSSSLLPLLVGSEASANGSLVEGGSFSPKRMESDVSVPKGMPLSRRRACQLLDRVEWARSRG